MTVKELIAALSRMPENAVVLVDGCEVDSDVGLNGEGYVDLIPSEE